MAFWYNKKDRHLYIGSAGGVKSYARALMEEHLNRFLTKNEIVHHIDGNSLNDNFSNLKLITRAEHTSFHHTGKHISEKHKEGIRKANTGRRFSEEAKKGMGRAMRGKTHSLETKAKMKQAQLERWKFRREVLDR